MEIKSVDDVRAFLDRNYITIQEFANVAGINRSHLSALLHGRYGLSRLTRLRLEHAANELAKNPPKVPVRVRRA